MNARTGTVAVLVCFEPDLSLLETNLRAIRSQVAAVVLVDNSVDCPVSETLVKDWAGKTPLTVVREAGNPGLGQALNDGLRIARTSFAARHVVFLDQDSCAGPDMVAGLLAGLGSLGELAIVGPGYREPQRQTRAPFVAERGQGTVEVAALITSGMLCPVAVFERVGDFEQGLFLDYVDTEWCFRAKRFGVRCYGVPDAEMAHRIGDRVLRIAGRNMAVHGPERGYYQLRNFLLLWRAGGTPRGWVLRTGPWLLLRSLVLALLAPPRWQRVRMMAFGIRHGVCGKSGSYSGR